MAAKITRLPQPASPTIEQVFDEFLGDQRRRLRPRTLSKYEDVLGLLRDHLNGYAYQSLSTAEAALFDRYYNAPGDKHLEFCQLFGPDKIVANLGGFLGYFMIRKVVAGQDLKRAAGTVTKKLSTWLAAQGHVAEDEAQEGADLGAEAARDLPKAERAARILYDATTNLALGSHDLGDDFLEFDRRTIAKQVERDRVRDDLLKKSLAKLDRAVPQHGRLRSLRVPPKFGALRDERTHHNLVIICRVDELDRAGKESIHLIFQAGALAVASPAAILHAELVHELIQRPT